MTDEPTNVVWWMYLSKGNMTTTGINPKEFMDTYYIYCGNIWGYVLKDQYRFDVTISYDSGCKMILEGVKLEIYPEYPRESIYFRFNGRGCGVFNEQSRDDWSSNSFTGPSAKRVCMFHQIPEDLSSGVCEEIKSCEIRLIEIEEVKE